MKRTIKSFTLIELLVVIVIIGILSGVIVISVTNYINDAKNTKIVAELSNLSKSFEGNSRYYVGSLCIEDSVSNPAFKSYYGLTSVPVHPNYTIGDDSSETNDCYLYFSDGDNYSIRTPSVNNQGYLIQESRTQKTQPIQKTCDTGWVPFGNRCVMQYEAKCSNAGVDATADKGYPWASCVAASGTVVSTAAGEPITNITQIEAKAACESIGTHLITNAEWMAIARDIEQVDSNWTGGTVGSGVLKRGNVGNTLEGNYNGDNPEVGVTNNTAKLKLSNGNEIYHLSGNVWDIIDDTIETNQIPTPTGSQQYTTTINWTSYLARSEAAPLGSYDYTKGVGSIALDPDTATPSGDIHIFLRSGRWASTESAGAFLLVLNYSTSFSAGDAGFRCVK